MERSTQYDLIVVGGGLSGLMAAATAAVEGKKVLLAESYSFLGGSWTGSNRLWLSLEHYELLARVFEWSEEVILNRDQEEVALLPAQVKIALEDYVMNKGVTLLYGVKPYAWSVCEGTYEVSFAGKFGSIRLRADRLIDATDQGALIRCTTNYQERLMDDHVMAWRTLELSGVDLSDSSWRELGLPAELAQEWEVHIGNNKSGHVRIRYQAAYSVLMPLWWNKAEVDARFSTNQIFKWLRSNHRSYRKAKHTASSQQLVYPTTIRAACMEDNDILPDIKLLDQTISMSHFLMKEGLWVASGLADIDDESAHALSTDPVSQLFLGQCLGFYSELNSALNVEEQIFTLPKRVREAQVLVIGGGTSGASAAIAAGMSDADTLLVDWNFGLGGTGTIGGVDSYWFGRREGFTSEISRLVREEHDSVGLKWTGVTAETWNVEAKMFALLNAARNASVQLLLGSVLTEVIVTPEGRVTGALFVTPFEMVEVSCQVMIDATGDGDAAVLAGAEYVYGSDREAVTMWYSMVPEVKPGVYRNNFTSTVHVGDAFDYSRALISARRRYVEYDHSTYIAPRESRHIKGEVRMTLTDQLLQKQWPDVVNIAFSNHDMKGHSTSDWIKLGLIPPNLMIEIPYRALLPVGIDLLLVTGKAISATHDALPAIRMQADLENLGAACGIAASLSVRAGISPRELEVNDLQRELSKWNIVPEGVWERVIDDTEPNQETMREWIAMLDDGKPLHTYADMGFLDLYEGVIPIVQVCMSGPEIIPMLREELEKPQSSRRLSVARALAWHGEQEVYPVLREYMMPFLIGDELPPRTFKVLHVQAPPDQGAMPELAYLLYTVAMLADERVIEILELAVDLLKPTWEKLSDGKYGMFYYVDSLCEIAERLGSSACIPALNRLLESPVFKERNTRQLIQADFFEERAAYLEIVIARALARCGDKQGLQVLIQYLNDARKLLVVHAHKELVAITDQSYTAQSELWQAWFDDIDELKPCPVIGPQGNS